MVTSTGPCWCCTLLVADTQSILQCKLESGAAPPCACKAHATAPSKGAPTHSRQIHASVLHSMAGWTRTTAPGPLPTPPACCPHCSLGHHSHVALLPQPLTHRLTHFGQLLGHVTAGGERMGNQGDDSQCQKQCSGSGWCPAPDAGQCCTASTLVHSHKEARPSARKPTDCCCLVSCQVAVPLPLLHFNNEQRTHQPRCSELTCARQHVGPWAGRVGSSAWQQGAAAAPSC